MSVVGLPPTLEVAERRNVLDRAHRGDLEGALGRVPIHQSSSKTGRRRFVILLAVMGPGLIVMAADNDAGGLSTFAQAGQDYGLRWVWLPALVAGALYVLQEMAARLGAVTGSGHARLIFERFGRTWGWFALGDLIALNVLTIVTELIGLQFGLAYFGISRFIAIPISVAGVLGLSLLGTFRRWERAALGLVGISLIAIPLLMLVHSHPAHHSAGLLPHPLSRDKGVIFSLAMIGTIVAPWQLFFQQSNVVDKRITTRWLRYERADTFLGTLVFALGAVAMITAVAAAFDGSAFHGGFVNAGAVATELRNRSGQLAGILFAVALIDGSILGAGVVSLTTGYAVGESTGARHSRHRRWRDAKLFYGTQLLCIAAAAAIVLAANDDLGIITLSVQALSGVLFPSAAVFLLLLCNDRDVLGPWVNRLRHNLVAGLLVAVLLSLSAVSLLRTAIPSIHANWVAVLLASAFVLSLFAIAHHFSGSVSDSSRPREREGDRISWSMPPIERLQPPRPSRWRTASLALLRGYVALSALAVVLTFLRLST
jgi:Mn2+/Fe2+ NRAMP family transporter